jgi:hypothetical protein
MTYDELVTAFEDAVENEFTTDVRAQLVKNAEYKIFDSVELPNFRKTGATALTSSDRFYTYPTDFRSPVSFAVINSGTYTYLLPKQQDFILEAYPTPATTGVPVHYAIYSDTQFILGPTPASNYGVLLTYNYYPESLVTDTTGTWLSDNFPLALVKATILEAGIFLKSEQDVLDKYQAEFTQAMVLLKNYAAGRLQSDKYRSGEVKQGEL